MIVHGFHNRGGDYHNTNFCIKATEYLHARTTNHAVRMYNTADPPRLQPAHAREDRRRYQDILCHESVPSLSRWSETLIGSIFLIRCLPVSRTLLPPLPPLLPLCFPLPLSSPSPTGSRSILFYFGLVQRQGRDECVHSDLLHYKSGVYEEDPVFETQRQNPETLLHTEVYSNARLVDSLIMRKHRLW